jgi:5'(3')-deoxyribonucleotidase
MIDLIYANKPFGLRYDAVNQVWSIVFELNLDISNQFSLGKQGDQTNLQQDASWLLLFTTDNEFYTVASRVQRYIFESDKQIRFYFDSSNNIYDSKSSSMIKDSIKVLSVNTKPDSTLPFTLNQPWDIVSEYIGLDGYVDTKKLVVTIADSDANDVVDDPELFLNIVAPAGVNETNNTILQQKYKIFEKYIISQGQEDYQYVDNTDETVLIKYSKSAVGSLSQYTAGQYFYFIDTKTVVKLDTALQNPFVPTLDYKVYAGRDNLKFQYVHNASINRRIDPSVSNIIDVFVLPRSYDNDYRKFLAGGLTLPPEEPTSDALRIAYGTKLNAIKSISDEIIYHPVTYKVLFGKTAVVELQSQFKVVKNPSKNITDTDLKVRIVSAINEFFDINNWETSQDTTL